MISQLLSKANLPSIFDRGAAAPAGRGDSSKAAGFSSILTAQGADTGAAGKSSTPASAEEVPSDAAAAAGTVAPAIAANGKILPPALPVLAVPANAEGEAGEPASGETDASEGENAAGAAVDPATVALIVAASQAVPSLAVATGETPSDTASAQTASMQTTARALAASLPVASGDDGASAPGATAPARNDAAPAASVALKVAPLPADGDQQNAPREALAAAKSEVSAAEPRMAASAGDRSAQRDPSGEQRPAPELAARPALKTVAETAPAQPAPVNSAPSVVAVPAPAESAVDGVRPFAAERPGLESQVARELTRIVDSLSAARESLTAKTATLAFDHAEFGELSLRFDQRRDGQLAVQLSAADPDAHRAVAAAVAERPAFAQSDAGAGAQQQQGQAGANGSARGTASDRESNNAGNNAARQERNEQQRGQARGDDTGRGGERRSGIFA